MSKDVVPADSLGNLIDRQIEEFVKIQNGKDSLVGEKGLSPTQTIDAMDLTPEQSALLAISSDLQNLLIMMNTIYGIASQFETYMRSLQSQQEEVMYEES